MIIAYGGGLILSLYQIENPFEELENSLKSDPHYVIEKNGDLLRVKFSAGLINDFVDLWNERLIGKELELFKEIMDNIYIDTRLDESGYFDAIIKIESKMEVKIQNEIFSNPRIKKGFSDELKSHFKDLYESVYVSSHKHTYIRYYETFSQLILIEDEDNFHIDILKEDIYDYFNNKLMNNIIKPTMRFMDEFEDKIQNQNFLEFIKKDILHFFMYYEYISTRIIHLRRNIWAMNYIRMCLNSSEDQIQRKDLFRKDLEGAAELLNSRKEVVESVKNSLVHYISFASVLLGISGVAVAIILSNPAYNNNNNNFPAIIMFIILLLSILLLFIMFKSIRNECEKPANMQL